MMDINNKASGVKIVVCDNGDKEWFLNGKWHRVGGTAVECANGDKEWFQNNERHRLGGQAIEKADGEKQWWLNGVEYTEGEYWGKIDVFI